MRCSVSPVVVGPGPDEPLTGGVAERFEGAASAMRAGGLVVAGPAGSGKSHLARVVLREFGPVQWVRADRAVRRVPFGAFLPLLGGVPAGVDEALVVAHRTLASSSAVLAVDDAHLLDDLSAALVSRLVGMRPVLVTVRTATPAPDPITALWKDGPLTRIDLPRPSTADGVALVEQLLGGRLQTASATALCRAGAGNLTMLRQLVADERAAGRLRRTAGIWHWSRRGPLGPGVADLVAAELGEPADPVLELVALAGRLEVDTLAGLTAPERVEEAADRGLIEVIRDGRGWTARPAHPLYAEAVVQRMSPPRLRRLCARLLDPLRSGLPGATREDRVRLGWVAMRAGPHPDPELLLAAARAAAEGLDRAATVELAAAAGAGFEADLLAAVGRTWWGPAPEHGSEPGSEHRPEPGSMPGADAEAGFRELAARVAGDERRELRVAQPRAVHLALDLLRPDEARAVLDAASRSAVGHVELLGVRALLAALDGRLDEALRAAHRALIRDGASAQARSYARCALNLVAAVTGEAPVPGGDGPGPPEAAMVGRQGGWFRDYGAVLAGRIDRLRAMIDRDDLVGGPVAELILGDLRGCHALLSGRLDEAVRLLAEFRTVLTGPGSGWTVPLELRLAMALGMAGEAEAAQAAVDRARSAHPNPTVFAPQVELAQAWVFAAEGSTSLAVRHTRRAARLAAESGQFAVELLARHAAVTFGDKGHAARITVLARRLRSPRAIAAAAHAAAFDAGDHAALLAAAARFADADLMLLAAEAAAQAEVVARDRVDPGSTAEAARATAGYLARCRHARTPALEAAARPLELSGRQRETAALVAAGLSNRQISERLGVSVRTVEGHIYHACVRLGVPNRAAFAALLERPAGTRDVA